LVADGDVALVEGEPPLVLQIGPVPDAGTEGLVVQLHATATQLLGPVHGGVGTPQESLGVEGAAVADGHGDAGRHGGAVSRAEPDGLAQPVGDLLGEGDDGTLVLDAVDHEQELVARQPPDEIGLR
jgi:hypothetical protein